MRFLFRWAFRLFLLLTVLAVALVLLKDSLLEGLLEKQISARTGFQTHIGKLQTGLLTPALTVEDLKLYNPAEFGGSPLAIVPDLHAEWDFKALAHRTVRLKLLRIHLRELNLVEKPGSTNLNSFFTRLDPAAQRREPFFKFGGIDSLNLTLEKVTSINLKEPNKIQKYDLNVRNQILTNIKTEAEFSDALLRTLVRNGIVISSASATGESKSPAAATAKTKR